MASDGVGQRRLGGHDPGRQRVQFCVAVALLQRQRRVHHLLQRGLCGNRHIGTAMLDSLVHTDRAPELDAVLGMFD